jgi:hypothetical protein
VFELKEREKRRDCLSTPWRTASTVAMIILLVLTLAEEMGVN